MWKYIVTYLVFTYNSLPQCDMGNGAYCLVAHDEISKDTLIREFYDRQMAYEFSDSAAKIIDSSYMLTLIARTDTTGWIVYPKIDSVIINPLTKISVAQ